MERDRTDPPLTVADLDAIEADLKAATSGRLTDDRGDGSMGTIATVPSDVQVFQAQSVGLFPTARDHEQRKANARALVSLWNASTPLLALARRGLEAEHQRSANLLCVETIRVMRENAESAESRLAAALAEVERVRGRLERATNFSWRNGEVWAARPEGATTWHVYKELGSCGAALIGKYDTLDAAWSAAEAQAGQAAKQGGEGRA